MQVYFEEIMDKNSGFRVDSDQRWQKQSTNGQIYFYSSFKRGYDLYLDSYFTNTFIDPYSNKTSLYYNLTFASVLLLWINTPIPVYLGALRNVFSKQVPVSLNFLIISRTVEGLICSFLPASERLLPSSTTSRTRFSRFCLTNDLPLSIFEHISASEESKNYLVSLMLSDQYYKFDQIMRTYQLLRMKLQIEYPPEKIPSFALFFEKCVLRKALVFQ